MNLATKKYRGTQKFKDLCKRYRDNLREKALILLGKECARCGENIAEFLAIDHIDNDGSKEKGNQTVFLRKVRLRSDRYQILYHNCNWSKHIENIWTTQIDDNMKSELKKCISCLLIKSVLDYNKSSSRKNKISNKCRHCTSFYTFIRKILVIEKMGGKCSCCKIDTPISLQIDHVNNDGNKRRREGWGASLYTKIINEKKNINRRTSIIVL